jgi:hypothetical protein
VKRAGFATRRTPAAAGAHSRRKGASWERDIARQMRAAMPGSNARRGIQSRSGAECGDVVVPHFFVEAKSHRKTNVRAALRQAIANAPPGEWPLAICKDDRAAPFVAMKLDDFLGLLAEWWAGSQQ